MMKRNAGILVAAAIAVGAVALLLAQSLHAGLLNKKVGKLTFTKFIGQTPDLNDKVILLDFWATWCRPCVAGIPHVNALHNKFKDKGLVVIGVTNDTEQNVRNFLNRRRPAIDYYVALDPQEKLLDKFNVQEIPMGFLIDRNGVVVWEGDPGKLQDATIEKALAK